MRAQGIAPRVALKFIFDGEEEMGSTHFAAPSPSGAATSWRPTSRS